MDRVYNSSKLAPSTEIAVTIKEMKLRQGNFSTLFAKEKQTRELTNNIISHLILTQIVL